MSSENPVCQQCRRELDPNHKGPCPNCGYVGKLFVRAPPPENVPIGPDEIHRIHTHRSRKTDRVLLIISIALVIIGAYIATIPKMQLEGLVIGIIFGALGLYIGLYHSERNTVIDRA